MQSSCGPKRAKRPTTLAGQTPSPQKLSLASINNRCLSPTFRASTCRRERLPGPCRSADTRSGHLPGWHEPQKHACSMHRLLKTPIVFRVQNTRYSSDPKCFRVRLSCWNQSRTPSREVSQVPVVNMDNHEQYPVAETTRVILNISYLSIGMVQWLLTYFCQSQGSF